MWTAMVAAVASFPNPTVALAAFLVLIQNLEAAQNESKSRAKGLASARDAERDALWTAMLSLQTNVQTLADKLPAGQAIALIESAGLLVAGVGKHAKALIAATMTTTSGLVRIVANAKLLTDGTKKRVTFNWQWSLDQKTWNNMPSTPHAETELASCTPMTMYWFRVSVTISKKTGAWSTPTDCVVTHCGRRARLVTGGSPVGARRAGPLPPRALLGQRPP
jgi:hypothetical protein